MKKRIRILSWNTDCSPIMYGRVKRLKDVKEFLKNRNKDFDIIALQELGFFKAGLLSGSIYYLFLPLFHLIPLLMMLWDYIMIFEGFIIPFYNIKYNDMHKFLKKIGYSHVISSNVSFHYINSGLVIASKDPIKNVRKEKLHADSIHRPGYISVDVMVGKEELRLINCYFVPTLENLKFTYLICRSLNKLFKKDVFLLREDAIKEIKKEIKNKKTVVVGDLNIDRKTKEHTELIKGLGLRDIFKSNTVTFRKFSIKESIDYILISKGLMCHDKDVVKSISVSDHYPVYSSLYLNN